MANDQADDFMKILPYVVMIVVAMAIYLLIAQTFGLWPMGKLYAVTGGSNP